MSESHCLTLAASGVAIVAKLLGARRVRSAWTMRCPAHNDSSPTLSIRDGDDGKVSVRCHADGGNNRFPREKTGQALAPWAPPGHGG
jgi:hypothetical protein